jgi:protein-S-isoprenylcysteine O-methyltransferase Ste14
MSRHGEDSEIPHGHLLQATCFVLFLIIWSLDSFIFNYSTFLTSYASWFLCLAVSLAVFVIGLVVTQLAHGHLQTLKSGKLVTTGIYSHVRHPLYLGVIVMYLGFTFYSFSLLSLLPWLLAVAAYNKMANYEEQVLAKRFGKEYLDYKKSVRKWI